VNRRIDEYNARRRLSQQRDKDRKKRARTVAKEFKEKARDEGSCRNPDCPKTNRYYKIAAHHIVHRSSFNPSDPLRDDVANCMPLCFDCHTKYHQGRLGQRQDWLLPEEVAFIVEQKGRDWLERRYPR